MRGPQLIRAAVDAQLARLEQEHLIEIELDDLESLLREPDLPTFATRSGPRRTGLEDLALTLVAAKSQPDELTVRVVLQGATDTALVPAAQTAMRRTAEDAALEAWRDAVAVRNLGLRLLPLGTLIAAVAAFAAYGFGYLAGSTDALAARVACLVLAGIAITVAWVVSWMVIEATMIDWRGSARKAAAYDLLSRATVEVVAQPT